MTEKPDISVIILTLNEELHIERCIKSLLPICKDIYLIDSNSKDLTVNIAKSLGAKVFVNPWPGNHARQFQWALDNCPIETKWVMKMDADEYVTDELVKEICESINSTSDDVSGYFVKRKVHFKNKWIRHGGYYPIYLLRLWRNGVGTMEQRWMDEHIKLHSGTTKHLENDLVDDNLNDLTWWTNKHNNYATREAADILNTLYNFNNGDGVEPRLFGTQEQRKRKLKHIYVKIPLFVRPFIYFIYRYFIKLGFLDGREGLVWHFLQGFWYRFLVDAKIFEIYLKVGKDRNEIMKHLRDEKGIDFG
ncbi:glycosyltransferase family 2 protein [Vibrio vulnificus]|nr:glycosyltransferase family 2 protein [Vibrio vulnificus]